MQLFQQNHIKQLLNIHFLDFLDKGKLQYVCLILCILKSQIYSLLLLDLILYFVDYTKIQNNQRDNRNSNSYRTGAWFSGGSHAFGGLDCSHEPAGASA